MRPSTLYTAGIAAGLACGLAACGGDGIRSSSGPGDNSLTITSANAKTAAATSYSAAQQSGDASGFDGAFGPVATNSGEIQKVGNAGIGLLGHAARKVPVGPDVVPCLVAGTVTLSGDIAAAGVLTAGDFLRFDYAACDDGVGQVLDGLIDLDVNSFSGDLASGAFALSVTATYTDFQVATAEDTWVSNGDTTVVLDATQTPLLSTSASGQSLTIDSSSESATLSDFASLQTIDAGLSPAPYTFSGNGSLSATRLSGDVVYSTPVTFSGLAPEFPDTGEFLVVGAGNSSARVVVLDATMVRVDVDTDGDGVVDSSEELTWEAFLAEVD